VVHSAVEECTALWEVVAVAQNMAVLLRAEVEEERLTVALLWARRLRRSASPRSAMAMMLRLQRDMAEVHRFHAGLRDYRMPLFFLPFTAIRPAYLSPLATTISARPSELPQSH
jgi:hypothetical protein